MPASATIALTEILAKSAVPNSRWPASSSALRPGSGGLTALPPCAGRQPLLRGAGLVASRFPPCHDVFIRVAYGLTDQSVNPTERTPMPTIHTRAGRVAYSEIGSGPTVLLLHATLHDRHDFDPILEALARRSRTIAVDWPGHGDSDPVHSALEPSAPLFADVLEDVVDGLGVTRTVLIGNSVGGFAAARLAINRPECVAGLVLVNAGGFIPLSPLTRTFCRVVGTPAFVRLAGPGFIRGYMKATTDSDRRIVAGAIAATKTAEGIRTETG